MAVTLEPGAVLPLVRELTGNLDPLSLYRLLSDGGTRTGTFLLESADTGGSSGERSVIGVGLSLRILCVDRTVTVEAMSANGRSILPWLAAQLIDIGRSKGAESSGSVTVTQADDTIRALFPTPTAGCRDESQRGKLLSPLDALRAIVFGPHLLAQPIESCHLAAGVFSYDLVELFETLPSGLAEVVPTPHFEFVVPDRMVIVDHLRHRTLLVANAYGGSGADANFNDAVRAIGELLQAVETTPVPDATSGSRENEAGDHILPLPRRLGRSTVAADLSDEEYAALVARLKHHIVAGDVFQIVASRAFSAPCPDPLAAYTALRSANPSPYLFYVVGRDTVVFGASPETAVKVSGAPRRVTIRPIAGTMRRGRTESGVIDEDLDARREASLRLDGKELAEHMMLVDLARNDVARVSKPGTRKVTRLLSVDRYSHVMHLVSEVEGELADGSDALHAYAAAMNMGTVVGAPKIRAAQILREVEPTRRGAYGGAVGYLDHNGAMDTAIVIRAAVVRDGTARVRAGAGIVLDSDPASEARETRQKAEAVLSAIVAAGSVND
jgi:anthranilate synthase component 1